MSCASFYINFPKIQFDKFGIFGKFFRKFKNFFKISLEFAIMGELNVGCIQFEND